MPVFKCPGCAKALSIADHLGGQVRTCPNCEIKFRVPAAPHADSQADDAATHDDFAQPAAERETEPSIEEPPVGGIPNFEPRHSPATTSDASVFWRKARGSNFSLALFDFKFEHYLTPWIIRFSWICVLCLAAVWILFLSYRFVSSSFSGSDPVTPTLSTSPDALNQMLEGLMSQQSPLGFFSSFGGRAIMTLSGLVAILLTVLWTRVMLETLIVIFNISNTLKSIEQKVDDQAEADGS